MYILKIIIAIFMPWLIFLFSLQQFTPSIMSLMMQTTLIGWPFASYWCISELRKEHKNEQFEKEQAEQESSEQ